jgi:hypothetical protein
MKNRYGRSAFAQIAIATVASGVAGVGLAAPSSANSWVEKITAYCEKPWSQVCKTIPTWDANLTSPTNVSVSADPTHCCDIIAYLIVDDRIVGSEVLGPGERTGVYRVPPGEHTIGVQGEIVSGWLEAWGGTLHFQEVGVPPHPDGPTIVD